MVLATSSCKTTLETTAALPDMVSVSHYTLWELYRLTKAEQVNQNHLIWFFAKILLGTEKEPHLIS